MIENASGRKGRSSPITFCVIFSIFVIQKLLWMCPACYFVGVIRVRSGLFPKNNTVFPERDIAHHHTDKSLSVWFLLLDGAQKRGLESGSDGIKAESDGEMGMGVRANRSEHHLFAQSFCFCLLSPSIFISSISFIHSLPAILVIGIWQVCHWKDNHNVRERPYNRGKGPTEESKRVMNGRTVSEWPRTVWLPWKPLNWPFAFVFLPNMFCYSTFACTKVHWMNSPLLQVIHSAPSSAPMANLSRFILRLLRVLSASFALVSGQFDYHSPIPSSPDIIGTVNVWSLISPWFLNFASKRGDISTLHQMYWSVQCLIF